MAECWCNNSSYPMLCPPLSECNGLEAESDYVNVKRFKMETFVTFNVLCMHRLIFGSFWLFVFVCCRVKPTNIENVLKESLLATTCLIKHISRPSPLDYTCTQSHDHHLSLLNRPTKVCLQKKRKHVLLKKQMNYFRIVKHISKSSPQNYTYIILKVVS